MAVTGTIRGLGAALVYNLYAAQGTVQTPWIEWYGVSCIRNCVGSSFAASANWLWLFNAWDSFKFGLIVTQGYSRPNYVYLPGYPLLIHFVSMIVGDAWLAGFLVTQTFAAASIVMFQLTAEIYMPPRAALYSTLLMATFPYILVFTTLGYSEAVFFFATISAWYFCKRGKLVPSTVLAGFASITRIYGIMILLPILLSMWKAKKINLYYFAVPVAMLAAWGVYCFIRVGDALASLTEESAWIQTGVNYGLVPWALYQDFRGIITCCTGPPTNLFDPAVLIAVALLPFLIMRVWDLDRSLVAYTGTLFVMLILTAPVMSLLRYLSFIFPIWLTSRVKNAWVAMLCMALFIPFSFVLWFYALTMYFIG